MDRNRRSKRTEAADSASPDAFEPESESSLLREARGWAGSARDAQSRLQSDDAAHLLETLRRNGPGQ